MVPSTRRIPFKAMGRPTTSCTQQRSSWIDGGDLVGPWRLAGWNDRTPGSVVPTVPWRPPLILAALTASVLATACHETEEQPRPSTEAEPAATSPAPPRSAPRATRVAIAWLPAPVARFSSAFEAAGRRHGVDAELLAIIALVESGGWSAAQSPSGARGLMQIMPSTGRIIADERVIDRPTKTGLLVPETSVDFGAWYLARQLERFGTGDLDASVELAAAAYNGGPTHLSRHLDDGATLAAQTARYRRWVGGMWHERRQARSETFRAWLEAGGERLLARGEAEMKATEDP
ncbi:MAG TPA: lytic transglycosylase domain-containing protein [Polyangiaceae bacterium]|nr:lytic transglycosylase domain-containing protein [Polyangiaceae bacterium]